MPSVVLLRPKLTDEALEQAKEIYDGSHAIVLAKRVGMRA